ncbi:hypothetical protein ACIBTP_19990 [Streptomyces avidinii]|uniref:hypothetical protein n=1 Tax=Streptomyces avidinii TaxID=1895 RepID=UPI0037BCA51D
MAGTAAAGGDEGGDKAVYTWHVGDDFLTQNIGSPDGSQARAANGDIITVEGTGAFTLKHHAASGGGTFKHFVAATGKTLTGTFQARKVKSFTNYGNGTPQGTPANFFGGLLVLHVDITPDTDPKARIPAVLTIDCLLGSPPAGAEEGINLDVPGLIDFDTIIPGSATVFVQL